MDFHSRENRLSYTTRDADDSWKDAMSSLVPVDKIANALDIGCGGGIYAKALADMGIENITAMDFSEEILAGAREHAAEYSGIQFRQGNAYDTGLEGGSFQLLLERALIHHLSDIQLAVDEAHRILEKDGYYIIQDRTLANCLEPGSASHIRGYFFEQFPRLIENEKRRRPSRDVVVSALKRAGFKQIEEQKLWETRQVHESKDRLLQDLQERNGRSILHELDDEELNHLLQRISGELKADGPVIEKDCWTIWKAVK